MLQRWTMVWLCHNILLLLLRLTYISTSCSRYAHHCNGIYIHLVITKAMQPSSNQKVMVRTMICFGELETNYWLHKFFFRLTIFHVIFPIDNSFHFTLCFYINYNNTVNTLQILESKIHSYFYHTKIMHPSLRFNFLYCVKIA